jgi:DNA-binding beta-propeller fold protein YncE
LSTGEPEPSDVAVSPNGDAYWTCTTAGVILGRRASDGMVFLVVSGLEDPIGIALDHQGRHLYFTEVPTPGMAGSQGGRNRVSVLDLQTGELQIVDEGDPEPRDVTVAPNGRAYWTCTSAGVIVEARPVK